MSHYCLQQATLLPPPKLPFAFRSEGCRWWDPPKHIPMRRLVPGRRSEELILSPTLLSLLLQCLDCLHRAKAKWALGCAGLCRNMGAELFCTSIGVNAARGHKQEQVAKQSM